MKKFTLVLIVIVFAAIVAIAWSYSNGKSKAAKADAPKIVKAQPVRGPMKLVVASTGRVASNLDVEIKCKASGQVMNLPFDISDPVAKDDLVVELDPVDEQRNVDKARVSLSASRARLKQAEQGLAIAENNLESARRKAEVNLEVAITRAADERAKADRMKQLYEQKLAGREEYETAETNARRAEADVETAKIQKEDLKTDEAALELKRQDVLLARTDVESASINLSIAEQRLLDTKVYAPIDGIVTARFVQAGQIISSGISTTGGGTPILTLSDLSRLFILASVDESDIGNVAVGQPATITADAYPGKSFDGVIERVAQKGQNVSNVVTFEVRIEVTSENKSMLKPEMTANVEIVVAERENVVSVPVGAVSRAQGKNTVTVLKPDGTTESREVQVGINNGDRVEIVSGLNEDDTILINESATFSQWRNSSGGPRPGGPIGLMGGAGPRR